MKCNRIAIYGWKSKKSAGKSSPKVLESFKNLTDAYEWRKLHSELFDRIGNPCEGEIISQIELEFIPYMGGSDANVEVRFRCNKCGHEYANENGLPYDLDSLNKFLTKIIKEL